MARSRESSGARASTRRDALDESSSRHSTRMAAKKERPRPRARAALEHVHALRPSEVARRDDAVPLRISSLSSRLHD